MAYHIHDGYTLWITFNGFFMGFNGIAPRKMVIYWDLMGFTLW